MPFVQVPKDLNKVKTKVALNLTKRQIICFSSAGIIGIPTYFLCKNSFGTDISAIMMITLMLPFFAFAIYEKDGQYLEKVIKNIIITKFIRPKVRPYKTDNLYAKLDKNIKLYKEVRLFDNTQKQKNKKTKEQEKKLQKSKQQLKQNKKSLKLDNKNKIKSNDKKRIVNAVKKAKKDGKIPKSSQQTIPYQENVSRWNL